MFEILLQKKAGVERCIKRARDCYGAPSDKPFAEDYDKQDVIVLNLQRACEQVLNMANHVIRVQKLGLPADSAESFTLLMRAGVIDSGLEKKLRGMVGFRNTVVRQYRDIDYGLVEDIIKKHADDLITFAGIVVALPE